MDNESGYNGWKTYETWCVHLWLTNDEGTYRYWREEARRHRAEAPECSQVKERIWNKEQAAKFNLADQLEQEIEQASPLDEATLFSDLLNTALSEVDWHEVAAAFLEDLNPSEEGWPEEEEDESTAWKKPEISRKPRFSLGQVVSTPGASETLTREEMTAALGRHHRGDWGDVCRDDWTRNEEALADEARLFSVYHAKDGTKFWVITEADRSSTCVLLPSEY